MGEQSSQEGRVELKYSDRYSVKNKLRKLIFDKQEDLDNVLQAYELIISQRSRGLSTLNALKSKIQILDHQIMAAKIVKNDLNGRALLADEVGLGKTIEAGIILKEYFVIGLIRNALVLTPPSLVRQWKEEMETKFDLDFVAQKDDKRFTDFDQHPLLIASLPSAIQPLNAQKLYSVKWDIIIVDEAHRLRNSTSKAHQFVKDLPKKFILLLSATPVQNNLQELYNMIEILKPGLLGSWSYFMSNYTVGDKARMLVPERRNELQDILSNVIIRTTRSEVKRYLDFTDRIPKTHLLQSSELEKELYEKATSHIRSQWESVGMGGRMTAIFPLMILQRQISSSTSATRHALRKKISKYPEFKSELEELVMLSDKIDVDIKMKKLREIIKQDPESKRLIFTEFVDTQDYIFDSLNEDGFDTVKFNGQMSTGERDLSVSKFKRDVPIMISTEAGGEGQNFQFCHNVVNYDLPWNPMRVEQRVGRVHRIGQEHDVYIHNFAITGTIEEYVLQLLYEKINLFKMTIGDLDLLFGDEGINRMPTKIFESYMSTRSNQEAKNKFSALGEHWIHKKENLEKTVMEFHNEVFANFDLSAIKDE